MAKPTRPATPTRKGANVRRVASDADLGFWHRPALMNLCADVLYLVAAFMLLGAAWAAVQRMAVLPLRQLVVTTPLQPRAWPLRASLGFVGPKYASAGQTPLS